MKITLINIALLLVASLLIFATTSKKPSLFPELAYYKEADKEQTELFIDNRRPSVDRLIILESCSIPASLTRPERIVIDTKEKAAIKEIQNVIWASTPYSVNTTKSRKKGTLHVFLLLEGRRNYCHFRAVPRVETSTGETIYRFSCYYPVQGKRAMIGGKHSRLNWEFAEYLSTLR